MSLYSRVQQEARGRWREILTAFGVPDGSLDGKGHPCPACGGTDRFRFDDKHDNGGHFCNQCKPSDGIGLIAKMKSLDREQALEEVALHLGVPVEISKIVLPVIGSAPPASFHHQQFGDPTMRWTYRTAAAEVLGHVCRFNTPKGKEIRTRTLWMDEGKLFWRWKNFPGKSKPLYGLDRLAARLDAPVLVCEGEKACDAATALLPDHVCISSYQGAQSPQTNDWSPLKGRRVVLWPDNDAAGIACTSSIVRLLTGLAASITIIDPRCIEAAQGL